MATLIDADVHISPTPQGGNSITIDELLMRTTTRIRRGWPASPGRSQICASWSSRWGGAAFHDLSAAAIAVAEEHPNLTLIGSGALPSPP